MTAPLWAGILLLVFGAAATLLPRLPPHRALAMVLLAAAGGLALLRLFPLAVPLAAVAIGLWRRDGGREPSPGGQSEVETPGLRMTLDRASGVMDGEVRAGRFRGARLSSLTAEELQDLVARFEDEGDEDSLSLLLAWIERHRGQREGARPAGGAEMSRAEAYRVLGLAPGASLDDVRAAYRRLMKRVHPDLGGSSALAAMLNAAKERLDPG